MQHGDISNREPKRLIVVFEGLVGIYQGPNHEPTARTRILRRIRPVVPRVRPEHYQINTLARDAIRDATMRGGWHVDIVTWHSESFADELGEYLPDLMVDAPVIYRSPGQLARELAHRPDVYAVYDPDPAHRFTFGARGVIMFPEQAGQIGRP